MSNGGKKKDNGIIFGTVNFNKFTEFYRVIFCHVAPSETL